MDELTEAELQSLRLIVEGTPRQGTVPRDHAIKLIDLEFVEQRQGGLVATGKGRMQVKMAQTAK